MNIKDLRYLIAVANLQHFGKAATKCHISQPTLSMQLKKLEDYLGVQLLERTSSMVLLTDVGRKVVIAAKEIVDRYDALIEVARESADPYSGDLKIGVTPSIGPYLLPFVLPNICEKYPKLHLVMHEDLNSALFDRLQIGELDCIIANNIDKITKTNGIESVEIYTEDLFLIAHRSTELQSPVKLSDLSSHEMLSMKQGHTLRGEALELASLANAIHTENYEAHSLESLRQMVATGLGVALFPGLALHESFNQLFHPTIKCLQLEKPMQRKIYIFYRTSSFKSVPVNGLADVIQSAILPLGCKNGCF